MENDFSNWDKCFYPVKHLKTFGPCNGYRYMHPIMNHNFLGSWMRK